MRSRTSINGRGITTLHYRYNMLGLPCVQQSVDSGQQLTLLDVAGQPLYGWDADNRQFHYFYDALRRPVGKRGEGRLLEEYVYGEGQPNDKDYNLRGQLYQLSDGAGQLTHAAYDFKGNLLETARQLLDDPTVGDVDWSAAPGLNPEVFTTHATYDALSRPIDTKDPGSNIQEYSYDSGGYLKTVVLNGVVYVQDIHYDAKGQRQAIWYGNDTKTSYAYEAATFRLRRLLTVNLATNDMVQDLRYWYDPVGNITRISDEAQQTLFYANQLVSPDQDFTYDALYRLVEAGGREQINSAAMGIADNWEDGAYKVPLGGDAAQRYTQKYTYDAVGNILELKHIAGVGSYTRTYGYGTSSNRLVTTEVGGTVYTYGHDSRGNMTAMPHLDAGWGLQNQMTDALVGGVRTFYQYDSSGQRVRKYTDKGSIREERIYLGSYEVYRKYDGSGNLTLERTTVHVSDDSGRIAMLETRTQGSDASHASLTRYIYSNHLQSATLELDDSGNIISYEEYHPYGTTAYQAMSAAINAVAKRYRFTGKERDEESGLYYHGARYYAPWLGRWTAVDPLESKYAPWSSYNYCTCNPINHTDSTGQGNDGDNDRTVRYYQVEEHKGTFSSTNYSERPGFSVGSWGRNSFTVVPSYSKDSSGKEVLDHYTAYAEHKSITENGLHIDAVPFYLIGKDALQSFKEDIFKYEFKYAQLTNYGMQPYLKESYLKSLAGDDLGALKSLPKEAVQNLKDPMLWLSIGLAVGELSQGSIRGNTSGLVKDKFNEATAGSTSAAAELRVAEQYRRGSANVVLQDANAGHAKGTGTFDMTVDGAKVDVKLISGLGGNAASNIAKGVNQVGSGGSVVVVRPANSKFTFQQYQNMINNFKPLLPNVRIILMNENALPKLNKVRMQ